MQEERRAYARVSCELPSSFKVFTEPNDGTSRFAIIKNISLGGGLICMSWPVICRASLKLSLSIPGHSYPRFHNFEIEASVVRTHLDIESGLFYAGIKFADLPNEVQASLENYIYS